MSDDIFHDDALTRWASRREPARTAWEQTEKNVARDVFEAPDETVAGLVWNFEQNHVDKIAALLSQGEYTAAKEAYDAAQDVIRSNWEGISSLAKLNRKEGYGEVSSRLGELARSMLFGNFNQISVTLSDGSQTTVGRALAKDSSFLPDKRKELSSLGFGEDAATLYLGNDSTMKSIIDPLLAARRTNATIPNRLQLVELADDYAANLDRVTQVFADGGQRFMSYLLDTHKTSGCGAAAFRTLLDFAEDYSSKTGVTGKQLARDVVTGYNDLVSTVFRSGASTDQRGAARPLVITDDQRRLFDATLLPALKATLRDLDPQTPVNLHDPRLKKSLLEVMDVLAYTQSHGVDVLSDARNTGYAVNDALGGYIRNAVLDRTQPSDNIVEGVRRLRADLTQRVTGGRSPQRIAASLTGRSEDYLNSLSKRVGTESLCPEADGLADTVHQYLLRELVPEIANGRFYTDAAADRAPGLVKGLAEELSRSFAGPARTLAAQELAQAVLTGATARDGTVISQGFLNGGNVNIEELIAALAFAPGVDGRDPVVHTLRTWYSGNVALDLQFGERRTRLRDSLLADRIPESSARRIVSTASSLAASAVARGEDPSVIFDNAESQGLYLDWADGVDAAGKPAKVLQYRTGNRNKVALTLDDKGKVVIPEGTFLENRSLWDQAMAILTARMNRENSIADAAARRRAVEAAKGDDALD